MEGKKREEANEKEMKSVLRLVCHTHRRITAWKDAVPLVREQLGHKQRLNSFLLEV